MMKTRIRLTILTGMAVMFGSTVPRLAARQDQQNQQNQQNQPSQDQKQTDQQPPEEKKGGRFGGLKKITSGQSASETTSTASGGSKGISDGKTIADKTPTGADRQQVSDMENYSVPQNDLKKFQDDGHLQPK